MTHNEILLQVKLNAPIFLLSGVKTTNTMQPVMMVSATAPKSADERNSKTGKEQAISQLCRAGRLLLSELQPIYSPCGA